MRPLVSIIVPIYNVEPFVGKCIESIIKQTYGNIEVILVDDGSPDNSGKICDEYAEKDALVHVIHQTNQGVSAARNHGLEISSGDYIMFVDGDDYIEPDYVDYFVKLIQDSNCDMAIDPTYIVDGDLHDLKNLKDSKDVYDSTKVIEYIYLDKLGVGVVNKIYKKSIIDKYDLKFNTDFWFAEGMLYNIIYLQYISKVAIGRKPIYHAVSNPDSATRKFNLESWFCGLKSMEFQRDNWIKVNQNIQMAWEYHYRKYAEEILSGLISSGTKSQNKEIYTNCVKALRKNLRIPLQVDVSFWRKKRSLLVFIDPEIVLDNTASLRENNSLRKKIKSYLIHIVYRIPPKKLDALFNHLQKFFSSHYKPYYLNRSLL